MHDWYPVGPFSLFPCSFKSIWAESPWNPNPQTELSSCTLAGLSQQAKRVRWQALSPRPQKLPIVCFLSVNGPLQPHFTEKEETGGRENFSPNQAHTCPNGKVWNSTQVFQMLSTAPT